MEKNKNNTEKKTKIKEKGGGGEDKTRYNALKMHISET